MFRRRVEGGSALPNPEERCSWAIAAMSQSLHQDLSRHCCAGGRGEYTGIGWWQIEEEGHDPVLDYRRGSGRLLAWRSDRQGPVWTWPESFGPEPIQDRSKSESLSIMCCFRMPVAVTYLGLALRPGVVYLRHQARFHSRCLPDMIALRLCGCYCLIVAEKASEMQHEPKFVSCVATWADPCQLADLQLRTTPCLRLSARQGSTDPHGAFAAFQLSACASWSRSGLQMSPWKTPTARLQRTPWVTAL